MVSNLYDFWTNNFVPFVRAFSIIASSENFSRLGNRFGGVDRHEDALCRKSVALWGENSCSGTYKRQIPSFDARASANFPPLCCVRCAPASTKTTFCRRARREKLSFYLSSLTVYSFSKTGFCLHTKCDAFSQKTRSHLCTFRFSARLIAFEVMRAINYIKRTWDCVTMLTPPRHLQDSTLERC